MSDSKPCIGSPSRGCYFMVGILNFRQLLDPCFSHYATKARKSYHCQRNTFARLRPLSDEKCLCRSRQRCRCAEALSKPMLTVGWKERHPPPGRPSQKPEGILAKALQNESPAAENSIQLASREHSFAHYFRRKFLPETITGEIFFWPRLGPVTFALPGSGDGV
jgi:hypothetical protein